MNQSQYAWAQQAAQRWPDIGVPLPAFLNHAQSHADLDGGLDSLHGPELYLCFACGTGDRIAQRHLETDFLPSVDRAIARLRLPLDIATDAEQRTRLHLLVAKPQSRPAILTYSGRGKLTAWLRIVGIRIARRMQARTQMASLATDPSPVQETDPEMVFLKRAYADRFSEAVQRAIDGLDPRARLVLALVTSDGRHPSEVAQMMGVHRTTVLRWMDRAHGEIASHTRQSLQLESGLSPSEADSMAHALDGEIEISLGRYLPIQD